VNDCPVYRAERAAMRLHPAFTAVVPDAQAFVDWTCNSASSLFSRLRWRGRAPTAHAHVTVGPGSGTWRSCLGMANIAEQHIELNPGVPPTQLTLLHEIAHLTLGEDEGHSVRFAAHLIDLVREWLGDHSASILLRELQRQEVGL